jgi:hypothetical protein
MADNPEDSMTIPVAPTTDTFTQPSYASPSDTKQQDIPDFKMPEHHPWGPFAGFLSHLNAAEDERAVREYQLNLQAAGLRQGAFQFQQQQQEHAAEFAQHNALLAEDRGIKHAEAFSETMMHLNTLQAQIDAESVEMAKSGSFLKALNPDAWSMLVQEHQHKIANRNIYEQVAKQQFMAKEGNFDAADSLMRMMPPQSSSLGATPKSAPASEEPAAPASDAGAAAPSPQGQGAPPDLGAVQTPEQWNALLQRTGLGFPEGTVEGGHVKYTVDSAADAARLNGHLATIAKMTGMPPPAIVEDRSKVFDEAAKEYHATFSEQRLAQAKVSFYSALEQIPKDTKRMLDMIAMYPADSEEAQSLKAIVATQEDKRLKLIRDIKATHTDAADAASKRLKRLQPIMDRRDAQMLKDSGVDVKEEAAGVSQPVSERDILTKFATDQGWDPDHLTPEQAALVTKKRDELRAQRGGK